SNPNSSTPVAVKNLTSATAIAAGAYHSCALKTDGTAMCWGNGYAGQIGYSSGVPSATPVPVNNLSDASAIAAGGLESCAILNNGTAKCWGDDFYGQLGNGTTTNLATPQVTVGLSIGTGAQSVAAGY